MHSNLPVEGKLFLQTLKNHKAQQVTWGRGIILSRKTAGKQRTSYLVAVIIISK
jgi:hypothetical protein